MRKAEGWHTHKWTQQRRGKGQGGMKQSTKERERESSQRKRKQKKGKVRYLEENWWGSVIDTWSLISSFHFLICLVLFFFPVWCPVEVRNLPISALSLWAQRTLPWHQHASHMEPQSYLNHLHSDILDYYSSHRFSCKRFKKMSSCKIWALNHVKSWTPIPLGLSKLRRTHQFWMWLADFADFCIEFATTIWSAEDFISCGESWPVNGGEGTPKTRGTFLSGYPLVI